jgi:nitroreductase
MKTITPTDLGIHELIANRRSPRIYQQTPIDDETLVRLFEAARWAASGRNRQPWNFFMATKENREEYLRIFDCLGEGNQQWARTAPVLMVVVAQVEENGAPIRTALYDTGLAVSNLTIQAMAEGIMLRQMGGFDREKARQLYHIPATHEPVVAIALGYPAHPETLPLEMREREQAPRLRKPLSEFVFSGKWGRTAPLVK